MLINQINSKQRVYFKKHKWPALPRKFPIILINLSCLTFKIPFSVQPLLSIIPYLSLFSFNFCLCCLLEGRENVPKGGFVV